MRKAQDTGSYRGNTARWGRDRLRAGTALACALALAGSLGLAGCGQSASEPGGSASAPEAAVQSTQGAAGSSAQDSTAAEASADESAVGEGSQSDASASAQGADDQTHGDSLDADKALEGQTNAHPVQFTVSAPGYSSSDGKIPIAISGTRVDGTMVDATAYLGPDGTGLELSPGQYTVTVIESPLMSGGRFFRVPGKSWDVVVGDTLASGESVSVEGEMVFSEMDLSELTEDEVDTAYTYAVSGGLSQDTADKYKKELLDAAGLQ